MASKKRDNAVTDQVFIVQPAHHGNFDFSGFLSVPLFSTSNAKKYQLSVASIHHVFWAPIQLIKAKMLNI